MQNMRQIVRYNKDLKIYQNTLLQQLSKELFWMKDPYEAQMLCACQEHNRVGQMWQVNKSEEENKETPKL